ncbi:hypothetical protein BHM03_00052120 [Ensete ventricosum]|nr:hypothetical protein BHM03_00052120 [Ensete ventricosum]
MQEDGGARCALPRMASADNRPLLRRRGGRGGWEIKSLGCGVGEAAQAINADPARQNRCGACSAPAIGDLSQLHEQWEKRRCREIGADLVGSVGRGKAQLDSIVGKVVAGGSRKASGLLLFARGRSSNQRGVAWSESSR